MSENGFCFCPLLSGSSGNATYIAAGSERILVDCGVSGKQMTAALAAIGVAAETLSALFITHAHNDHLRGAGVLSRRYHLPIYASGGTWREIERWNALGEIAPENIRVFDSKRTQIDTPFSFIQVECFPLPHDTPEPVGYRFSLGGKTAVVATDIGYITPEIQEAAGFADMILLESNHDLDMLKNGSYPWPLKRRILSNYGHLSNDAAGLFAVELVKNGVSRIYLGHLSQENNRPQLALETVAGRLSRSRIDPERDVELLVARRSSPSEPARWQID